MYIGQTNHYPAQDLSQPISAQSNSQTFLGRTPDLQQGTAAAMRSKLRAYFLATFDCYESLFECLAGDKAFVTKSINLRHPLIFYFGHTATFFY